LHAFTFCDIHILLSYLLYVAASEEQVDNRTFKPMNVID
jgi:hypothetical protein